jgi:hypothetical protein
LRGKVFAHLLERVDGLWQRGWLVEGLARRGGGVAASGSLDLHPRPDLDQACLLFLANPAGAADAVETALFAHLFEVFKGVANARPQVTVTGRVDYPRPPGGEGRYRGVQPPLAEARIPAAQGGFLVVGGHELLE